MNKYMEIVMDLHSKEQSMEGMQDILKKVYTDLTVDDIASLQTQALLVKELIARHRYLSTYFNTMKSLPREELLHKLLIATIDPNELEEDHPYYAEAKATTISLDFIMVGALSIKKHNKKPRIRSGILYLDELGYKNVYDVVLAGICFYIGIPAFKKSFLQALPSILETAVSVQTQTLLLSLTTYADLCWSAAVSNITMKDFIIFLEGKYNDFKAALELGCVVIADADLDTVVLVPPTTKHFSDVIVCNGLLAESLLLKGLFKSLRLNESGVPVCDYKGETKSVAEIFNITPKGAPTNLLY